MKTTKSIKLPSDPRASLAASFLDEDPDIHLHCDPVEMPQEKAKAPPRPRQVAVSHR